MSELNFNMMSVEERVLSVAREVLTVKDDEQLLEASIRDQLKLTSLEQMTLFIALEDEFDQTIPQEEVAHLDSMKEIVQFIEGKLGQAGLQIAES